MGTLCTSIFSRQCQILSGADKLCHIGTEVLMLRIPHGRAKGSAQKKARASEQSDALFSNLVMRFQGSSRYCRTVYVALRQVACALSGVVLPAVFGSNRITASSTAQKRRTPDWL